jgi:hypothetical protein
MYVLLHIQSILDEGIRLDLIRSERGSEQLRVWRYVGKALRRE